MCKHTAAHTHTIFNMQSLDYDSSRPMALKPPDLDKVFKLLAAARKLATSREILLWMTPSEAPKALQASECSELLDPMRASCWIFAQH